MAKGTDQADAMKPAYQTGTSQKPYGYANMTQPADNDPWGADWHNGAIAAHTERAKADPQAAPQQYGEPSQAPAPLDDRYKNRPDPSSKASEHSRNPSNAKELA